MSKDARAVPTVPVDWRAFRERFPVTERLVYMNTGWSGPSAREVVEAVARRAEREAFDGPTTLEVRNEKSRLVVEARAALASTIGAADVALLGSTTEGVNAVLHSLGLGPGDEVLTSNLEHSSLIVPVYHFRRLSGAGVTVVRSSATETADELAALFADAITDRTKLVAISHIAYNRGTRLPVRRIIEAAHARGALVLLDGAQAVGQMPVDVKELGVDFYAFPAHKFLLAPDASGGLYVRPELLERVEPRYVSHHASEYYDFEGSFTPRRDTPGKFQMATHSGPLLAGTVEAVRLINETGIPAIESRLLALSQRLLDGLARIRGVTVRSPLDPALRSALVTFTVGDQDPNETCAALWQLRRVVGRVVGDKRLRLSIAPFNDEADVDAAVEAVEHLASRGLPDGAKTAAEYKDLLAEDND